MFVAHLTLTDFRNHAHSSIEAGAGLNVLAGANGAGKTNLLEAVSLLAPGRGLRGAPLAEMVRDCGPDTVAASGFTVLARCCPTVVSDPRHAAAPLSEISIGTAVTTQAPGRRRVRVNGADASAATLAEWLSVLWLTPAMDRLFIEAASHRRRFLDRLTLALSPTHAHHASRYDAALRARGRLLGGDQRPDPQWLDALEAQLADHGCALDAARHDLLNRLATQIAAAAASPFARPLVALVGSDGAAAVPWQRDVLAGALAQSRARDAVAGRALVGPHRVDLLVRHADHGQPAARCSTGEQKALLLALILAHGDLVAHHRAQRPILLLDELAAHLDPERRAALFVRLAAAGGQVWMSGTEAGLFDSVPSEHRRWSVAGGIAERMT